MIAMTNPFADGPDKGNHTEQMLAIKRDPATAFRQMGEVGFSPRHWGITDPTKYGVAVTGDPHDNPFLLGPEDGNFTAQMQAFKADPEKAMKDMLAAGHEPKDWGINPEKYGYQVIDKSNEGTTT